MRPVVPLDGTDIHVALANMVGADQVGGRDVRVQQASEVLITTVPGFPQLTESFERLPSGCDCPPNPMRVGVGLLHFDVLDDVLRITDHRIKHTRVEHRKENKVDDVKM